MQCRLMNIRLMSIGRFSVEYLSLKNIAVVGLMETESKLGHVMSLRDTLTYFDSVSIRPTTAIFFKLRY